METANKEIIELSEVFKKGVEDNFLGVYFKDGGVEKKVVFTLVWVGRPAESDFTLMQTHMSVWDHKTDVPETNIPDEMPEYTGGISEKDIRMMAEYGRDAASIAFKDIRWGVFMEVRSNVVVDALRGPPLTSLIVHVYPALLLN